LRLTLPVAHPEDLARPADDLPANLNRSSAHWGLIPYWCKDAGGGRKPINAKGETVASLPSFREAYRRRRCVLPIDNFFEWKAIKGERAKQPFAIGMKSGKPFALAGIWGNWQKPGSDEWVRSFAIITTTANELVSDIHERMPVIIPPESYDRWLSSVEPDPRDLLVAFPATLMTMWPISTRVNKPENDDADLLRPIEPTGGGPTTQLGGRYDCEPCPTQCRAAQI